MEDLIASPPATFPGQQRPASRPLRLSWRRRLLFLSVILSVVLVLQEAAFRFFFPVPEVLFNRADYMPHLFAPEISEQRQKALCNVIVRWDLEPDGASFNHTLNLYGFRGPNFSIAPPVDRPRILFLGDSFVEGCGASDDDTLPRQFERLLSDQPTPEVLNLGGAALDFPQYWDLLRDSVRLLRPDTVFLVVFANDFAALLDLPSELPTDGLAGMSLPPLVRLNNSVPRAWQALELLARGWVLPWRYPSGPFPFFAPVPSPSNPLSSRLAPPDTDPELELAMRAGKLNPYLCGKLPVHEKFLHLPRDERGGVSNVFRWMNWYCQQHETRLLVVYIPYHGATNPLYIEAHRKLGGCEGFKIPASLSDDAHRTQQRHLAAVCRANAIPFLDSTDAFIAGERERRLFWPYDGHCNAAGYHLLAELCARQWRASRHSDSLASRNSFSPLSPQGRGEKR